jgi:hypothetical protein
MNEIGKKLNWKRIVMINERIAKALDFKPKEEWVVGNGKSYCFSPGNWEHHLASQKVECDKFLKEQHEKFPEGWVVKEKHQTMKIEHWPMFHCDWNLIMEAVKRLEKRGIEMTIVSDIEVMWNFLYSKSKKHATKLLGRGKLAMQEMS